MFHIGFIMANMKVFSFFLGCFPYAIVDYQGHICDENVAQNILLYFSSAFPIRFVLSMTKCFFKYQNTIEYKKDGPKNKVQPSVHCF
jgi:hypothetical protein